MVLLLHFFREREREREREGEIERELEKINLVFFHSRFELFDASDRDVRHISEMLLKLYQRKRVRVDCVFLFLRN